jgi:DNA-binding transcriptional LysR family regulator
MKVFMQVARLGSFSAAADVLGISKAMVSKHISRLEDSLDVQLLNRTTRSLSLTEVGTVYHDRIKEILNDIDETELSVSKLSSEPRGTLRMTAPTSFGSFHLSRMVADYLREHPHVSIEMILTERTPDLVEEGLDLAIRIGNLGDSSLFARKITDARMIVCGSADYLDRNGVPETPEDLLKHNCLTHTTHTGEAWSFKGSQGTYRVDVQGTIRSNAADALRIAAIQGCGLVHLPIYMLTKDLSTGRLVSVLNEYEGNKRPIHAVYLHRMHLSAKVRTFVDFLYTQYQNNPIEEPLPESTGRIKSN